MELGFIIELLEGGRVALLVPCIRKSLEIAGILDFLLAVQKTTGN